MPENRARAPDRLSGGVRLSCRERNHASSVRRSAAYVPPMPTIAATVQTVPEVATTTTSTTAQWASAGAATTAVLVALAIAIWGNWRDRRERRRAEMRTACLRLAEWCTDAQKALDSYAHEPTAEHRRAAIECSNRLTTAPVHLYMIIGLEPPIRRTIDVAGMTYLDLINWMEADQPKIMDLTRWKQASVRLLEELRALCDYR